MAATLSFYRQCGLDIPEDFDGAPHAEVLVTPDFRLLFDTTEVVTSFDTEWQPPRGGHRIALAIECSAADEVDTIFTRLTDAGYRGHLAPFDAVWGQRYAVVLDPDGNPVDFYAAL